MNKNFLHRLATQSAMIAVGLLSVFAFGSTTHAQLPQHAKDTKSTVTPGDYEKINLYDGQFSFELPLASLSGRGTGTGVELIIAQRWRREDVVLGYSGGTPNIGTVVQSDPDLLAGIAPTTSGRLMGRSRSLNVTTLNGCGAYEDGWPYATEKSFSLTFNGYSGQSFSFISEQNDGDTLFTGYISCGQYSSTAVGTSFVATDGSGTKFMADSTVYLTGDPGQDSNDFLLSGYLNFPDGSVSRIDGGYVTWTQDRNGNKTSIGYTNGWSTVTDSLNRQIQLTAGSANSYLNYLGTGGTARSIRVGFCSVADPCLRSGQTLQRINSLFPWLGAAYDFYVVGGIKDVELPNGQKYQFFYNSYGELARVVFPTGGAIEYDYQGFPASSLLRRIAERRVYSDGVTLDNKTVYEYSDSIAYDVVGNIIPSERWTKVKLYDGQGALKSLVKHYFYGCIQDGTACQIPTSWVEPDSAQKLLAGREKKSETYDSDGTTLLRQTDTTYEPRRRTSWAHGGNSPYVDYRVTQVVNTLADSGQVSKTAYGYDGSVPYNLQFDVFDYDYGAGSPGGCLRRTRTNYEKGAAYTSDSVHLLNLVTSTVVSNDCNNFNTVDLSVFEYDNYSTTSNHAPLVDRTSITGHNTSFGTTYTPRGNVTRIDKYTSVASSTFISSYSQYDIAGNIVRTIDPNGNSNTVDYSDRFGLPDDEAQSNSPPSSLNGIPTYAFASSAANPLGWTTYAQRDYYTGAVVDSEDTSGNISTTYYADSLDRPTQTIANNNRSGFRSQATASYDDVNRKVTITGDSKTYADSLMKSESFYDGFGRTTESREYEDQTNYIATKAEYDSLGRAYRACNPYRPYLSESAQWTTTSFDSLGRVLTTTTADGAVASRSYNGTTVTVTDQALRSRSGVTDALGRLTQVIENNGGTPYNSYYIYDVLGHLRKTSQSDGTTTQYRYFMYDDTGRLIRAKQVEQGVNSSLNLTDPVTGNTGWSVKYDYDNNGNIVSTTDALNRQVTGTYDVLNRLTYRYYTDQNTSPVTFTYDDANIANSRGQLTAVSSNVSTTTYNAFDILGRVTSSSQNIAGQTYTFPNYTYDLSGALVSQTYPSGRIVTTETDDVGRLSAVESQLPNAVQTTMLSQLAYTSFGAVKQARLGNDNWESAQFDPKRLQVTQIGLGASAGDTSLLKLEFSYGTATSNNGSLLQQKITVPGTTQIVQDYTYDNLNRLYSATESVGAAQQWKQTFNIDRFGNRRFDTANTTTFGSCPQQSCNPDVDLTKNQFKTTDGYNYDAEGNLTASSYDGQTLAYDAENRIKQATTGTAPTENYVYDGNGRRVKKTDGAHDTYFVYDAFGKLAAEYTTNQPVSQNGTQYLTADQLGSPRVITNAIGAVVSRHDYMPFGEETYAGIGGRTSAQGYGLADNARQHFTGYERDTESGLDFARNRYLASKNGRFTSADPLATSADIKAPQTLNRYSYANNSPYKFTDPLGLKACGSISPNGTTGTACTEADDDVARQPAQKEFNDALAHYIFDQLSKGYVDPTGGMTRSMFDVTQTRVLSSSVSLNFSVGDRMVTGTRSNRIESLQKDWRGHVKAVTWGWTTDTFQIGASSGVGECMNDPACAVDSKEYENKGPIPIGDYVFYKSEIARLDTGVKGYARWGAMGVRKATGLPVAADWGSFRVPLYPLGRSMYRSGFFLHGGEIPGSLGCIDVGNGDQVERLLEFINSSSYNNIRVSVVR